MKMRRVGGSVPRENGPRARPRCGTRSRGPRSRGPGRGGTRAASGRTQGAGGGRYSLMVRPASLTGSSTRSISVIRSATTVIPTTAMPRRRPLAMTPMAPLTSAVEHRVAKRGPLDGRVRGHVGTSDEECGGEPGPRGGVDSEDDLGVQDRQERVKVVRAGCREEHVDQPPQGGQVRAGDRGHQRSPRSPRPHRRTRGRSGRGRCAH